MPLAVARRAGDDRIVIGDSRLLRRLRDVVDIGAKCDDRFARSPRRDPGRRNAGDAALDREAVLLQDARQVLRRFELLEAEFAEAEHLIDHLLCELVHGLEVGRGVLALPASQRRGQPGTLSARSEMESSDPHFPFSYCALVVAAWTVGYLI